MAVVGGVDRKEVVGFEMSAGDGIDVTDGGVDFRDLAKIVFPGLSGIGGVDPMGGDGEFGPVVGIVFVPRRVGPHVADDEQQRTIVRARVEIRLHGFLEIFAGRIHVISADRFDPFVVVHLAEGRDLVARLLQMPDHGLGLEPGLLVIVFGAITNGHHSRQQGRSAGTAGR